ncbi:hypothetical protein O4H53_14690 [Sulfitobacter sp. G21635-S1]|uniref:hypothetical protein n=1 Tax=Sulfitobacter sp. G21635-S1 TaxID=3014043 RepID=UPI0022B032F0|nr:hypothetical protein [Sulfitobacter sp. G21635-S1]MCZ4256797.1 hypothetical protein [Sulfitobacter sp. G21635-S1]
MCRGGRKRWLRAAALGAVLCAPLTAGGQTPAPPQDRAQETRITLPEARAIAVQALKDGEPVLAYRLAEGLLQADPRSAFAHFTLAQAHSQLQQPSEARRAAARAYRLAETPQNRFEAARLAASMSYREDRKTLSQIWVRRAVQNAPDARTEAQLGRDYARLRAENPWQFSIQGGLRPSSNVNNGSEMAVQIIDGLPFIGTLSGAAKALSGTVGHLDTRLGYKLWQDRTSRTTLEGRLYVRRVALSDSAKAQAPTATNSDYGATFAELGLSHEQVLGDGGTLLQTDVAAGRYWSGGDVSFDFLRLGAGAAWRLNNATRLNLGAKLEQRQSALGDRFDTTVLDLDAGLRRKLENGDGISLALNLRHTDSDFFNARYSAATLRASYVLGRQIGPAQVSTGITAGYSDYPDFAVFFAVPGGRQDRSVFADVNFFFADLDYAGFAPNLRISAGRTSSNVSRYETRELSVSLGVRSKF